MDNKNKILGNCLKLLLLCGSIGLASCIDLANSRGTYDGPYDGGYRRDDDYYRHDRHEWRDRERERELDRERERIEDERRRLEEERRRSNNRPPPQYQIPRVQEHCPSGFHPSEQKCSNEERRRGCKDMRLSSGLGCVKR